VHASLSSQGALFEVVMHPITVSQLSSVQSFPSSGHTVCIPPPQAPPAQASSSVHALPSLQGSVLLVAAHTPDAHCSSVQTFPSSPQSPAVEQESPGAAWTRGASKRTTASAAQQSALETRSIIR
jgi:hypothetical protein